MRDLYVFIAKSLTDKYQDYYWKKESLRRVNLAVWRPNFDLCPQLRIFKAIYTRQSIMTMITKKPNNEIKLLEKEDRMRGTLDV